MKDVVYSASFFYLSKCVVFITFVKICAMRLRIKNQLREYHAPAVMGILNLTPDSFYAQSKTNTSNLIERAKEMLEQGADFIDVGAYSSRPGAEHISLETEWQRLQPALERLASDLPEAVISVDTFRAEIARRAVESYGVAIINDISAGDDDTLMFETIADLQVPYIAMHKRGAPQNMQNNPYYADIQKEIILYFAKKIEIMHLIGIADIIIDPGFGFGKTLEHNYLLLQELEKFTILEKPILVGLSRKSMIYKTVQTTPAEALIGTAVLNAFALERGADILRVHDVKEAKQTITLYQNLYAKTEQL